MIVKIERKQDQIFIWDYAGTAPIIVEHDEAFDMATTLLKLCGQMKQETDEEVAA